MAAFLKLSLLLVLLLAACHGAPPPAPPTTAVKAPAVPNNIDTGLTSAATLPADSTAKNESFPDSPTTAAAIFEEPLTITEIPTTVEEITKAAPKINSAKQITEASIPVIMALLWI